MDSGSQPRLARYVDERVERKGLRPRLAASIIAGLWLVAVVVFGVVEHLVNPDTFHNVWLGMWWATQTVTTVGYGDVVPDDAAGRAIAAVLMIGGLSLFAVVTGVITSMFVARAQEDRHRAAADPVLDRLAELGDEVAALRREVARRGPAPPAG